MVRVRMDVIRLYCFLIQFHEERGNPRILTNTLPPNFQRRFIIKIETKNEKATISKKLNASTVGATNQLKKPMDFKISAR